jgi:coenzyme F420-reducing hydrogenase delta subunit
VPDFDPKIIAFCCDQSGYAAADMAGMLKLRLPKNVEIVRVPCAGRIETIYLLKALEKGADGILVFACYEENCQFLWGNLRARGRLSYAHRMLEKIGLEKGRLEICPLPQTAVLAGGLNEKSNSSEAGPNPARHALNTKYNGR